MRNFLVSVGLAFLVCSCATGSSQRASEPSAEPTSEPSPEQGSATSQTEEVEASEVDPWAVVDPSPEPDLQRLAEEFVSYALGDADSFPHGESVSMAIGGRTVLAIDDFEAALSNRSIWKICPADWEIYGASSCPVDLLGPIRSSEVNKSPLVLSAEYDGVACAPTRLGPLPPGRLVVLRPEPMWRTCATDFALALVADEQGRLRSVDITLSEPDPSLPLVEEGRSPVTKPGSAESHTSS